MPPRKNFWLWGIWGKRIIKKPFLTQKVEEQIRNIVIGPTFIIALQHDGTLVSWGSDKNGCLGLGSDVTNTTEPQKISKIGQGHDSARVIDIQYGNHHILTLTDEGKVYSWGQNEHGQLGAGDMGARFDPVLVEGELDSKAVIQILAFQNSSFALTKDGTVYAWGKNLDGELALDNDAPRVFRPEPMVSIKDNPVKKLEIKNNKTIIAYVDFAPPLKPSELVGGYDRSFADPDPGVVSKTKEKDAGPDKDMEKEVFEGVDLMRQVNDNTQEWWKYLLDIRHGMPYDDNPLHKDPEADPNAKDHMCSAEQLDQRVDLPKLQEAVYEIEKLITAAKAQLLEIRAKQGTKNVNFMLSMFIDDCRLRLEKIKRTQKARELCELKRIVSSQQTVMVESTQKGKDAEEKLKRLSQANTDLQHMLRLVRQHPAYDVVTKELRQSVEETIECKLQVHETQIELIKKSKDGEKGGGINAPLRTIKERWGALKHFSIFSLYNECVLRGARYDWSSDDDMLAYLVKHSDTKIDQIIDIDKDMIITRDSMVPALCYELLVENAELRKMCNTYQLKVLQMRDRQKGTKAH